MSQAILFFAMHVLGLAACLAFGPRTNVRLACALGFPAGLAISVILELTCLGLGIPFGRVTGWIAAALVLGACLYVLRRRGGLPAGGGRLVAAWSLGFAVVAAGLTSFCAVIMSPDSFVISALGRIVAFDGAFEPGVLVKLADFGVFQVLVQSQVSFTGWSFLWALPPVLAASTLAYFVVALDDALDILGVRFRGRALVIALLAAATFTIYMLVRHSLYIHTNFGSAAYLLVFCSLYWMAEVGGDTDLLPPAFLAIAAFSLHRIEAPIVATVFLSLAVLPSKLPARAILRPLAACAAVVAGWYLLLARGVPADNMFLTPTRCLLIAGLVLGFAGYAALARHPRVASGFARFHRWLPAIVAIVFVLALAAAFALRYEHMFRSAYAWLWRSLLHAGYWRSGWRVIALFALVGLLLPAPRARWTFVVGIPAGMAIVLLLVLSRPPYYKGMGDSATRMALHFVPLAYFYFGLKFIPLLGVSQRQVTAATQQTSGVQASAT